MTYQRKLYEALASKVDARLNCQKTGNTEWFDKHTDDVERLVDEHMPSGSGVDTGTKLDWERSTGEKLVFTTAYHHMDENGYYDGWTDHDVVVTPSLVFGMRVKITGRNRRDIKDYLGDLYREALNVIVGE